MREASMIPKNKSKMLREQKLHIKQRLDIYKKQNKSKKTLKHSMMMLLSSLA